MKHELKFDYSHCHLQRKPHRELKYDYYFRYHRKSNHYLHFGYSLWLNKEQHISKVGVISSIKYNLIFKKIRSRVNILMSYPVH